MCFCRDSSTLQKRIVYTIFSCVNSTIAQYSIFSHHKGIFETVYYLRYICYVYKSVIKKYKRPDYGILFFNIRAKYMLSIIQFRLMDLKKNKEYYQTEKLGIL